jgi:feruloyl-CoA synthase
VEDKLEIRVRGPGTTPGYWREPQLTAAAFDEEGYYRMGDAVRLLDEGDPTRGLVFDGRIAEDFKLANGTWVSVGPLRALLVAALSPIAQDVVIAGLDRDYVSALIVPDLKACARFLQSGDIGYAQAAAHGELMVWIRTRLQEHAALNRAATRCIRRAMVLPSPPSLDQGEITDKGSINQRAVLRCRAELVAALYADVPPALVIAVSSG